MWPKFGWESKTTTFLDTDRKTRIFLQFVLVKNNVLALSKGLIRNILKEKYIKCKTEKALML